jgi:hypothetical protein
MICKPTRIRRRSLSSVFSTGTGGNRAYSLRMLHLTDTTAFPRIALATTQPSFQIQHRRIGERSPAVSFSSLGLG